MPGDRSYSTLERERSYIDIILWRLGFSAGERWPRSKIHWFSQSLMQRNVMERRGERVSVSEEANLVVREHGRVPVTTILMLHEG